MPSVPAVANQSLSGAMATASTSAGTVWRRWPVSASQVNAVPSSSTVASQVLSGAITTARTGQRWPASAVRGRPSACQIRTSRYPALASHDPSGAMATAWTSYRCPVSARRGSPVALSQVRTVPSAPAVATQVPSGAIATEPASVARVCRSCPVAMSQSRTSSATVASQIPSGATATATMPVPARATVPSGVQVAMSQSRAVPSLPAVTNQ